MIPSYSSAWHLNAKMSSVCSSFQWCMWLCNRLNYDIHRSWNTKNSAVFICHFFIPTLSWTCSAIRGPGVILALTLHCLGLLFEHGYVGHLTSRRGHPNGYCLDSGTVWPGEKGEEEGHREVRQIPVRLKWQCLEEWTAGLLPWVTTLGSLLNELPTFQFSQL